MKKTDLHMHSIYSSDGEFSPKELVGMCRNAGIQIMAIADHNSVRAVREVAEYVEQEGIEYISAIEIDCIFKGIACHLLGYGIDAGNPGFNKLGDDISDQEQKLSLKKLELTNKLGFNLTVGDMDAVADNGVYTGESFAEVLLSKPEYKDSELLLPYREGGLRNDNPFVNFYWDYYSQGKPCYTEVKLPQMRDMIDFIHENGGTAVLAHPGQNLKGKFEVFDDMTKELDLDGVEAFSSYHDEKTAGYFYSRARGKGMIVTCGSDFHGRTKPSTRLGEHGCTAEIDVYRLLNRK